MQKKSFNTPDQTIDYSRLTPTRDYIQDISKIIGKVQQAFIPADPNDWYKGLEINKNGLVSQKLINDERIELDLVSGVINLDQVSWSLQGSSSLEILSKFIDWIKSKPTIGELPLPELISHLSTIDFEQSRKIAELNFWAKKSLEDLKSDFSEGVVSPVLLFPHHFDEAIVWFPDRTNADQTEMEHQFTLGFSTGDDSIVEPYFYVTEYPESAYFRSILLPEPAFHQTKGFSGTVLKFNDIANSSNPNKIVKTFFATSISHAN